MKKFRKGFTLVELLIVISILGALSASMAGSMGNATATAKASTIAANVDTCIAAAKMYYAANYNENLTETTAAKFLAPTAQEITEGAVKYVPNWDKFDGGNVVYAVDASGKDATGWAITVTISTAPDKDDILAALKKIPAYSDLADEKYIIKVVLSTGEVSSS